MSGARGLDRLDHRPGVLPGRAQYDRVLERARLAAYPPGEYVGQESFMSATEIRDLAVRAGIGPGVAVLDLCCGIAGPGRLLTTELGCDYLGVDADDEALAVARDRAGGLRCRFRAGRVPPLPTGPFDVVLLLETMLAFPDKRDLVTAVAAELTPGGRFAFTVEAGRPLTGGEQDEMPHSDTVWPVPEPELRAHLAQAGLRVHWLADHSAAHRRTARALATAFAADRTAIAAQLGSGTVDALLASHRLWSRWLATGRIRKLAVVAGR